MPCLLQQQEKNCSAIGDSMQEDQDICGTPAEEDAQETK
jgi:hypothetical protein